MTSASRFAHLRNARSAKRGTGVSTPAVLALEDGTVFRGVSVGAKGNTTGEVVFNTAMTRLSGDPDRSLLLPANRHSDLSRTSAIPAPTPEDLESGAVYAAGLVIRDLPLLHSNWRATESLRQFLLRCKVVAIADIDTRKLTRLLREKGAQAGCIMTGDNIDEAAAVRAAQEIPRAEGHGPRQGGLHQEDLPVERRRHLEIAGASRRGRRAACMSSPMTSASSATSCAFWPSTAVA